MYLCIITSSVQENTEMCATKGRLGRVLNKPHGFSSIEVLEGIR